MELKDDYVNLLNLQAFISLSGILKVAGFVRKRFDVNVKIKPAKKNLGASRIINMALQSQAACL